MVQFKDIAHLYLGCLCIPNDPAFRKEKIKLTGISYDDQQRITWAYFENTEFGYAPIDEIKPILRPLSSMTTDEFKTISVDVFGFHANDYYKQSDSIWCRKTITKERLRVSFDLSDYNTIHYWEDFTPENVKLSPPLSQIVKFINQCRKLSFDMDGLIESGQAIDATTIPPSKK